MADPVSDIGIKADEAEVMENIDPKDALKGRKASAKKLRRIDSLHLEAGNVSNMNSHGAKAGWAITMHLAFQSIGVVYGDIGTSPLNSVAGPLFWPTFIVAVAAAIIASQAVISCVFSIIAQAQTLGCFPRVKVVHTSPKYEGQVYIPELNYALMAADAWYAMGTKMP